MRLNNGHAIIKIYDKARQAIALTVNQSEGIGSFRRQPGAFPQLQRLAEFVLPEMFSQLFSTKLQHTYHNAALLIVAKAKPLVSITQHFHPASVRQRTGSFLYRP